jgi:DNA-binding response OmpR family regulator
LLKPALPDTIMSSIKQALEKRKQNLARQSLVGVLADTLAVLQKTETQPAATEDKHILRGMGIVLDLDRRMAQQDGQPLALTPTEFQVLAYLMAANGSPVTAEELVVHVQGYRVEPEEARSLMRVHVSRLRQKVEVEPAEPRIILTVRGIGYAFGGVESN